MDKTGNLLPTALNMALDANLPITKYNISELALKVSSYYLKNNRPGYALETAIFIDEDERKRFYRSNGFINEYVNLLQETKNLSELYRFLKGCKNFEEGANIAMKFNDITNYIILRLMTIRSKLLQNQIVSCQVYSIDTQQNDAIELHLLLQKTKDDHLQQELLYYITVLEGRKNHTDLKGYFKIKAFDLHVNVFKDDADVPTIFKNLRSLLSLHNNNLNPCMIKFFDVLNIGDKYYISPLMLQELELCVSDTKVYKRDEFGMAIMNGSQLQALFRKHNKSIAEKWLKIVDEILGYKDDKYKEQYHKFSSYVKVPDITNVIYYYINNIERKYYYDSFHINCNCPIVLGNDISVMLKNLLSFPWICYIPAVHKSVETFTWNPAIKSAIKSGIGQIEIKGFVEKWVFHGVYQKISSFINFTEETIYSCLSTEIEMIELSPVVSKLEIITIGLLGIFSNSNCDHKIVLPQSYEIVTGFFDSVNDYSLFSLITNLKMNSTDILLFLRSIVDILLGDMHSKSMLSMAISMKYSDNYPILYQFERCFVLALTLLGNLASYENNFYMLFNQSFKFLKTLTNKLRPHQKDFIPVINKIVNATTTKEVFIIINTIQQFYKRSMVTFNHHNSCFKKVLPAKYPCFQLYAKPKIFEGPVFTESTPLINIMQDKPIITHKDAKEDPKSCTIHDSEIKTSTLCEKQVLPAKFPLHPKPNVTEEPVFAESAPLNAMQDKPIAIRKDDKEDQKSFILHDNEVKPISKKTIYKKQELPAKFPCFPLIYPKPKISKEPDFAESASLITMRVKPTVTHKDDKEDPKISMMHDSEVKSISNATLYKKQGSVEHNKPNPVPRELKLLPYFMLTKEEKTSYGHIHIDKQVTKNS